MIPPDNEIFDVEQRIAARRAQAKRHAREAATRAMQGLASPVALIAAVGIGFLVGGGFARRQQKPKHPERRKSDHTKAAKATGLAGLLLPAAMWFVRMQWGSPVHAAQMLVEKLQRGKAAAPAAIPPAAKPRRGFLSPRGDMTRP